MTDEPDNIVLRYLRRIDERLERLEHKVDDLAAQVRESNAHIAALMQAQNRHEERFLRHELRLERIERRLDLTEPRE